MCVHGIYMKTWGKKKWTVNIDGWLPADTCTRSKQQKTTVVAGKGQQPATANQYAVDGGYIFRSASPPNGKYKFRPYPKTKKQ